MPTSPRTSRARSTSWRRSRPDGIRDAIEEPARAVGLVFEEGLVGTILDDLEGQPGSLPLLQYALLELWKRRRGGMLTLEGYRESGGVHGRHREARGGDLRRRSRPTSRPSSGARCCASRSRGRARRTPAAAPPCASWSRGWMRRARSRRSSVSSPTRAC